MARIVEVAMADLLAQSHLLMRPISSREVVLCGQGFMLDLISDLDGVSLVYFDTTAVPPRGCDLLRYLVERRSGRLSSPASLPETSSYPEHVEREIRATARILRESGSDVLKGDKDWLRGWHGPFITMPSELMYALDCGQNEVNSDPQRGRESQ
jgi:hypothetical protein